MLPKADHSFSRVGYNASNKLHPAAYPVSFSLLFGAIVLALCLLSRCGLSRRVGVGNQLGLVIGISCQCGYLGFRRSLMADTPFSRVFEIGVVVPGRDAASEGC